MTPVRTIAISLLPTVLVLTAAGGGIAYTALTASGADRTVQADVWSPPDRDPSADDPAADQSKGRTDTDLSAQLLPAPKGYRLGSDFEGLGNDTLLGPEAALEYLVKDQITTGEEAELQREEDRAALRLVGIRQLASRSYAQAHGDHTLQIDLLSLRTKRAAQVLNSTRSKDLEDIESDRTIRIDGYKEATCVAAEEVMPADEALGGEPQGFGAISCTGYQGKTLVRFLLVGVAPLPDDKVAKLFKQQLDRLEPEGERV